MLPVTCLAQHAAKEHAMNRNQSEFPDAYDYTGISGFGFTAVLVILVLAVWLVWTQLV